MNNNLDTVKNEQQERQQQQLGGIDPKVVLSLFLKNWYWFILSILVAFAGTRFYIGHTLPVYQTSVTILINETGDRPLVDNSDLLQGLGLPGGMKNLENQMMILKSRALTETALKELPFEIEYFTKTIRNRLPFYPETPIRILFDGNPLPLDTEFMISILDTNSFRIESQAKSFIWNTVAAFGEEISLNGGSFRVELRDYKLIRQSENQNVFFTIHSRRRLVNNYISRLTVELVSKGGSLLRLKLEGTNRAKDADFLNKLVESFQGISLDKKNTEANRRIRFIDDQLVGITDSLLLTENRLQQFRSSHRVMDLSAQGQSLIGQVTLLENERARLSLEANYYDYLADYLNKDVSSEVPIIPITMGITDPGLTRLVEELAVLQSQLTTRGAGELNPLQRSLEQRVTSAKEALRETLNGLRRANSLARSENQEQINKANSQAAALPVTERQLLGIERKFQLNNELYTFLLETRAEQELQKASNRSDSEVIDPADERFSKMISPNPLKVYFVGLMAGFGIPFLIFLLLFLSDNKLKDEDIRRFTKIPIVGNIPHMTSEGNTVVFNDPNSTIAEAFRLLRSRMQFFTKGAEHPVVLVTSSISGEGKTFTAINLASVYSLLGIKTVLVGFDLRKPRIYQDFNLTNEKGVSTWLIGQEKLDDIIQETSHVNLSVISAGPVPPNPSELTALKNTEELLVQLRKRFEIIVIDSSPIGLVSDTFHLASLADACLLMVRPGHTLKHMIENTLNEISSSGIKGVSLIINDIMPDSKHYSYGEKYGYTKDNARKRSLLSFRKKAGNLK